MEAKGFIERAVPERANSRPVIVLSDLGRSLEEILVPLAIATNETAISGLSGDDIVQLRRLLAQLKTGDKSDE